MLGPSSTGTGIPGPGQTTRVVQARTPRLGRSSTGTAVFSKIVAFIFMKTVAAVPRLDSLATTGKNLLARISFPSR